MGIAYTDEEGEEETEAESKRYIEYATMRFRKVMAWLTCNTRKTCPDWIIEYWRQYPLTYDDECYGIKVNKTALARRGSIPTKMTLNTFREQMCVCVREYPTLWSEYWDNYPIDKHDNPFFMQVLDDTRKRYIDDDRELREMLEGIAI